MKDMREMINLMESVMAVPGLNEKSTSEKQARFMAAAAHDPKFAKRVGIEQGVAKEFNKADTGTKQLSNAMKHKTEEGIVLSEPDDDDVRESVPAVDSCQQSNPANADEACAMEGMGERSEEVQQALADFQNMTQNLFMDGDDAYERICQGLSDEACAEFDQALEMEGLMGYSDDEPGDNMTDAEADADTLASAGMGSDEDYGYYGGDEEFEEAVGQKRGNDIDPEEVRSLATMPVDAAKARAHEIIAASRTSDNRKSYLANQVNRARTAMDVTSLMYNMILSGEGNAVQGSHYSKKFGNPNTMEEDFNLQNGYDDINDASGNDYFPNGADSPVVRATGPSGARQGDNPEQKKMQVAEVHKELVYGYRNYLKETALASQKKKLTENTQVSNLEMQDWGGDCDVDDEAIFDGGFNMAGKALGIDGKVHEIGFDVDVKATADTEWQSDESPTGWNYKTDNPTYTSSEYLSVGDPTITEVKFSEGMAFYVDGNDLYLHDAQKLFDPNTLKQLLNPDIYKKLVGSLFDKKAANVDPPEQDYYEPERGESRW